jgi:hypothetical protein
LKYLSETQNESATAAWGGNHDKRSVADPATASSAGSDPAVLVAAVEPSRSFEGFAARKVNAAVGAWNHGLGGRRTGTPVPLACAGHDNVDDDAYRD